MEKRQYTEGFANTAFKCKNPRNNKFDCHDWSVRSVISKHFAMSTEPDGNRTVDTLLSMVPNQNIHSYESIRASESRKYKPRRLTISAATSRFNSTPHYSHAVLFVHSPSPAADPGTPNTVPITYASVSLRRVFPTTNV